MRASSKIVGVLAGAALVAMSTVIAIPAGAAPASGCSGRATSYDDNGKVLDTVAAPGKGGTASDPFHIDVNGKVVWSGTTADVIRNGRYTVQVSGYTVVSGSLKNGEGKRNWNGTEDVAKRIDKVPVLGWLTTTLKPTAVVKAEYTVTGQGQTCSGSVVLKIGGSPTFTPLWFVSIALFLTSFWLLFWPGAWSRGGSL